MAVHVMDISLERMLTARQVADVMGVSISTVRRWGRTGQLVATRVGPRGDRRYRPSDIAEFVRNRTEMRMGRSHFIGG